MIAKWIKDPTPVWKHIMPFLSDDGGVLVTQGPFVGVMDNDTMAAAFYVRAMNDFCAEVHGGAIPKYYGKGVEICMIFGHFLFDNTIFLKIVAVIPEYNRLMRACVQKAGMKPEGTITRSFMKFYRMHDQHVYGITKGESKCLQS